MTPAELNTLNRLVSEKVMGWKWYKLNGSDSLGDDYWCQLIAPEEVWPKRYKAKVVDGPIEGIPDHTDMSGFNPAESPADAMAVLKKLLEKPQDIHIDSLNLKEPGKPPIKIWGGGAMVEAPTLELAITQFAVKLFQ